MFSCPQPLTILYNLQSIQFAAFLFVNKKCQNRESCAFLVLGRKPALTKNSSPKIQPIRLCVFRATFLRSKTLLSEKDMRLLWAFDDGRHWSDNEGKYYHPCTFFTILNFPLGEEKTEEEPKQSEEPCDQCDESTKEAKKKILFVPSFRREKGRIGNVTIDSRSLRSGYGGPGYAAPVARRAVVEKTEPKPFKVGRRSYLLVWRW